MSFLLESLMPAANRLAAEDHQHDAELIKAIVVRGRQLLGAATQMLAEPEAVIADERRIITYGSDLECYDLSGEAQP